MKISNKIPALSFYSRKHEEFDWDKDKKKQEIIKTAENFVQAETEGEGEEFLKELGQQNKSFWKIFKDTVNYLKNLG